jgi:hypothetical protein
MSPDGFAPCRVFELGPSRGLARAVVTVHAAAALAVLAAQLPWPLKVAAAAALAFSGRRALRRHAMRTATDAVVRLMRRDGGGWAALRNDGTAVIGPLADRSYVHPWLVIVGIEDGWRTLYTPVPADALPPDDHRRLRVWVKWQPPKG